MKNLRDREQNKSRDEKYLFIRSGYTYAIYGVNENLPKTIRRMRRFNMTIRFIIDRRAEELQVYDGIPVVTPEDLIQSDFDSELVIIICLMNAMQHDGLARMFYGGAGYRKILYVPMREQVNEKAVSELRQAYNLFLLGDYESIGRIPYYSETWYEPNNQLYCFQKQNLRFLLHRRPYKHFRCLYNRKDNQIFF